MPNFFYYDANGQKFGPVNDGQLKTLALRGIITPQTQLETESGQKGLAGQIPGLSFPSFAAESKPKIAVPIPNEAAVAQYRYSSDTGVTPIFPLLTDTSFRELLPETLYLWIIKIAYVTGAVAVVLGTLFFCGTTIYGGVSALHNGFGYEPGLSLLAFFLAVLAVPFICIGGFLAIIVLRLICEWGIITFHYMIVWTIELIKLLKTIRIYLDVKSKRE
ncbi:hypothetical protein FACS189419_00620 [Planctomycetales bacterium]|nr:hypothetical protein FACS189419_00620 [Planctomycetales bacterium]